MSCNGKKKNDSSPVPKITSEDIKLQKEIERYPDSLLLKENLLQLLRDKGEYHKAIQQADLYIKSDSLNERLWHINGILNYENGDTSKAADCFTKAMKIIRNPNDLLYLATIKAHRKDSTSLLMADDLITNNKNEFENQALFIKGIYFSEKKDYQKSIAYFDSCLKISYTFMEAYREKAICLYQMKKYEDAVKVLQKAILVQNSYDEGYYYLGQCYEKMNLKDEAIASYRNALLYSPDYTEAKDALKKLGN